MHRVRGPAAHRHVASRRRTHGNDAPPDATQRHTIRAGVGLPTARATATGDATAADARPFPATDAAAAHRHPSAAGDGNCRVSGPGRSPGCDARCRPRPDLTVRWPDDDVPVLVPDQHHLAVRVCQHRVAGQRDQHAGGDPPLDATDDTASADRAALTDITSRGDTALDPSDDVGRFSDAPTPSPLPGPAKTPGAVTFGERQPTRASSSRPVVSRTTTPSDGEFRGFTDQRTPSGFIDQRTPGFGDQRTPEQRITQDQRAPTDPSLPRSPTGGPLPARVTTDNAVIADEAFKRGELAMKRDQPGDAILEFKTACDLNPSDVDYAGMLAWAKFCAAGDKPAIGADTRKILERAVFKSNRPERARFYLGRVERMLGRDKEALRHFQEVLDLKPNHADAASEIRAIEARLQTGGKTGLFGRKR